MIREVLVKERSLIGIVLFSFGGLMVSYGGIQGISWTLRLVLNEVTLKSFLLNSKYLIVCFVGILLLFLGWRLMRRVASALLFALSGLWLFLAISGIIGTLSFLSFSGLKYLCDLIGSLTLLVCSIWIMISAIRSTVGVRKEENLIDQ